MNRRKFIRTGVAGLTGLSVVSPGVINLGFVSSNNLPVDKVKLGETGLTVSRIAMETGTVGYNKGMMQGNWHETSHLIKR